MAEQVDWLADGTPFSPRFGDRYRSDMAGGRLQAQQVFLAGCGLPQAWAGAESWCVLETGFGLGLNFLETWQAWRDDPARPRLLHYAATEAHPVDASALPRSVAGHADLAPLAEALAARWWELSPGCHRMAFEDGRVLLTLLVGDTQQVLRDQQLAADSVFLDGFSPDRNPGMWSAPVLKVVARCCRRDTRIATWTVARTVRDALAQAGFAVDTVPGVAPKRANLHGRYAPAWTPRPPRTGRLGVWSEAAGGRNCVVVGAGIAGAAVASSLARRGWQVSVVDAAPLPAAGASSLPAGIFSAHRSADGNLLSRLTEAGVRCVLETGAALGLRSGEDWQPGGLLERIFLPAGAPAFVPGPGLDGESQAAAALQQLGLPADTAARWHPHGGWLKPAALVEALMRTPGIVFRGGIRIAELRQEAGRCEVFDDTGRPVAQAPLVVVAAGWAGAALLGMPQALQPIAGQMSLGPAAPGDRRIPFPVNGHGSFVAGVPLGDGRPHWLAGASFERDSTQVAMAPGQAAVLDRENAERLARLLPAEAARRAPVFEHGHVGHWRGVRGATADRMPLVGPVAQATADTLPSVWACTGFGSRGLTLALLCGELLAARLHGEPLPVTVRLAAAVATERLWRRTQHAASQHGLS